MNYKLILILIVALVARLINLNQSFWLDEAAQLSESNRPISQLFDQSIVPHPPLYRILMHFWLNINSSEIILRLPSVIFGVATVFLTYFMVKHLCHIWKINPKKSDFISLGTALVLAINQYNVYYSQEFRPYALAGLLGTASTYFFLKRRWLWYFIISVSFIYTTYFAPFLLIVHFLYNLWFIKDVKHTVLWIIFILATYIPYLPFILKQLQVLGFGMTKDVPGWSDAVSVPLYKVLPLIFFKFSFGRITFDNKYFYGVFALALFLFYSFIIIRVMIQQKQSRMLTVLLAGPVILAFVVSVFVPVIAPQRLIFCLPLLLLLYIIGLSTFKGKIRLVLFLSIIFLNIVSLSLYYRDPKFQREQWRQAVNYIEMDAQPRSLALFVFPQPFGPWDYYQKGKVQAMGITTTLLLTDSDLARFKPTLLQVDSIYYFQYLTGLTDRENKLSKFLQKEGLVEKVVKDFPGVGFVYKYAKN